MNKFISRRQNYKSFKFLPVYAVVVTFFTYGIRIYLDDFKAIIRPPTTHSVVLEAVGYSPAELTVRKGDTVVFTTTTGKQFWPASDLHPTHTIYPEFDAQQPINPNASWSFTFTKVGSWSYHDHLAPLFLGTINVKGARISIKRTKSDSIITVQECQDFNNGPYKMNCWEKSLQNVLDSEGITAGFNLYAKYYNSEPYFAQNCHGFTHKIGEASYKLYSQKRDFDVTQQVAYCSYGFFHGFIEAMFQDTGSLDQAHDFCDYIDNKLKNQTSVLSACIHGIGHGVTDGSDPSAWGNVKALIDPGKKLCEQIGRSEYEKHICGTGIFNALEGLYQKPQYKLTLDRKDPFWICRQQDKDYFRRACFDDFKDIIMAISNNDFAQAAKFVEGIEEDSYAATAIDNLATYAGYFILRKPSYDYAIDICHNLQPRLHVGCVSGLGAGFMTAGEPDREYIKALELCGSTRITRDESRGCFTRVLRLSKLRYTPEIHKYVCSLVDKKDKENLEPCKRS